MPQGVRATRLFVAGGDAKRTRGVTMTPQEPYPAPRACRFADKRGYVKSSAGVGDAEPMAASDVAFLAPELVSEAEGPVPVPAPAEGRLGYRFVKRVFDIAFSACAIAVLLVPSIVLCIAIRLESPGCPIYSQKRVGRIGRSGEVRTFDMYKFRSMHKDADERLAELQELNEADGPLFKIKDDPRVTRIGKFIRKHSIDELPQFLNCLAGQLSCVGPRPPLPSEVAQYDARAMRRLSVKPGLTGYWQVRGRSDTGFEEMVDLDLCRRAWQQTHRGWLAASNAPTPRRLWERVHPRRRTPRRPHALHELLRARPRHPTCSPHKRSRRVRAPGNWGHSRKAPCDILDALQRRRNRAAAPNRLEGERSYSSHSLQS